ncbi:hypothetical protein C3K47_07945 [Solitalea longa]|uniref:Uncharacterized protein n=1 Tax=Solitalea longa TaxID=2079460 RepID=A0A2S5A393_9SPHI|nr:hypothetical protein [Solitalea longa]POY36984.1 hypothetical protein C3K47_07945 [Solitalea longa]
METGKPLNFQSLLNESQAVINADAEKLEWSTQFYNKARNDKNYNAEQLQKMYDRLQSDLKRQHLFSELLIRLFDRNYAQCIIGMEQCFIDQLKLNGNLPMDYVFYYRKENDQFKVYFMPL